MKLEVAKIFKQEGFIRTFKMIEEGPQGTIRIYLKYAEDGEPAIHGLQRVSRPGCRIYRGVDDLPKVRNGLGVALISTNRGVLTDEQARGLQVGGEAPMDLECRILVNSAGLIPEALADVLTRLSQVFIVMALVGVGLTTKVAQLRQTGPAPFLMGLAVAVMLAVVSLALFVAIGVE